MIVALAVLGIAAPLLAQGSASGRATVEQISPAARPMPIPQSTGADATSSGIGQVSQRAAGRAPTAQIATRDRNPRITSIPGNVVDACDEAARGKREKPEGVDCASILQLIARTAPQRSAEEVLLLGDGRDPAGNVAATPLLVPDADQVARQLNVGDVDGSPVAQAVGAQFQSGVVPSTGSAASPPVIIPGGSGGVIVVPPQ